MKQWEYRVKRFHVEKLTSEDLAQLGEAGWQLAGLVNTSDNWACAVFMRPAIARPEPREASPELKATVQGLVDVHRRTGDVTIADVALEVSRLLLRVASPRRVGLTIRVELGLNTARKTAGAAKGRYMVVWDEAKVRELCEEMEVEYE